MRRDGPHLPSINGRHIWFRHWSHQNEAEVGFDLPVMRRVTDLVQGGDELVEPVLREANAQV